MIDGEFVIDGVVHAYNQTRENFADEVGGSSMTEMAYLLAKGSNDPMYELSREVYLSNWSVDDLATLMFRESQTDVAVFHHLALASFHNCDMLVTWNCKHLANANKFGHIHRVNALLGLRTPALVTPLQLLEKEDEN